MLECGVSYFPLDIALRESNEFMWQKRRGTPHGIARRECNDFMWQKRRDTPHAWDSLRVSRLIMSHACFN